MNLFFRILCLIKYLSKYNSVILNVVDEPRDFLGISGDARGCQKCFSESQRRFSRP